MGRLADQLFGRAFVDDEEEYQRRLAEEQRTEPAFSLPPMPDRSSAPQGEMPTAQEEGREDLSPDAVAGAVKRNTPDNFLDAVAPAAGVAGGLAALPLVPGVARALPGLAATALGLGPKALDYYRQSPRLQQATPPLVEGVVLGEAAPPGAGAQQASDALGVAAPKILSAAERRAAENVAGRAGVLADRLEELKGLAGETQQGMAEFLSRRGGEIKAEQAARGLLPEAADQVSRRGGARAVGKGVNAAGEYVADELESKAAQRGGPLAALGREAPMQGFSFGSVPETPGGTKLGSGFGGFDPNAGRPVDDLGFFIFTPEEIAASKRHDDKWNAFVAADPMMGWGAKSLTKEQQSSIMAADEFARSAAKPSPQYSPEALRAYAEARAKREPLIGKMKESAIAGRAKEAEAVAAAEAAAREAERAPATIDAAFSDPTDKARATTRASTLDLGGERGAALIPGGKELKEFASHFQFQPKLEEFMLKPGYTVADAAARLRTANAAEPWLATRESKSILRDVPLGERFRAWLTGSQTKDAIAFRQYVEAADELENLKRGQVVASGRDRGALAADMAQAENAIGKPRMDELRARLKGITDTSFDELVAAGEADPSMYRPDYVRNIYTEKARERMTAFGGSGAGGFGAAKPGATNARKGFEGDKEDVLSATAFGRYEAGKAYNFAKTIRDPVVEKFSLNEALRLDPQGALAGDTVLFTFDHGVSNRIINQYDTKRVLSGMDPVQLNPALKTQAFQLPGPAGKTVKYHAIPGPLAEGLADLMANEGEFGKFSQVMAKANQATTTSLLSFPITNLPYEVGQLMSDTGSALQAVAGMGGVKDILTGKGPRILVKESAKALRELATEYTNVYWRKLRPTLIRDLTRKNLFGVNWESMYEDISDAAPEVARLVSENALPMHERGKGAAAKAVFLSPYAITDLVGKARESTLMRGVSKAAETLIPGMSSEGATALARARMGGYDKKSAAGRAFAPLMLFHKWFLSAAQNLTTRAVQDPLTKKWGGWKRLPQNMAKSPLVGVGITYVLLKAWNRVAMGEWGREVEDNVLPSTQTAAFVMPVTDKGEYVGPGADLSKVTGKPVVIEPETFLQMVLAGVGGAFDAATGKSGRAAEDLARFTASRGSPIVRGPIEALMGQRIKDGSSIESDFEGAPSEVQIKELKRRGAPWAGAFDKIPFNPFSPMGTEHVLEQLSYAPSFLRRSTDPDQTAWETAQTLGSPFRVVNPQAKEYEDKRRESGDTVSALASELNKPAKEQDDAKIDSLINRLEELGADDSAVKAQITKWRNAQYKAENMTREEREERKYKGLPNKFGAWLENKRKKEEKAPVSPPSSSERPKRPWRR